MKTPHVWGHRLCAGVDLTLHLSDGNVAATVPARCKVRRNCQREDTIYRMLPGGKSLQGGVRVGQINRAVMSGEQQAGAAVRHLTFPEELMTD